MDDSPLNNLFDGVDSPAINADSSSSTESPPSSTSSPPSSQSPPPASPPPSTQSTPPTNSSGFPSSPPADTGGSPPSHGSPPAPKAVPSPPAPKRSGDGGSSSDSGNSKGGSSPSGRDKSNDGSPPVAAIVAGAVIGVLAFSLLLAIAACVCCTKKKKKKPPHMNMPYYTDANGNVYYANSMPKWQNNVDHGGGWHPQYSPGQGPMSGEMSVSHGTGTLPPPPQPGMSLGFSKSSFSYEELASATGGFSSANLLGQGGFGYVYKGVLPGSGKEVAVKQLKSGSGQGEREFQAEVEIISRVHHRHLVSLVGYCIAGSSQRLLVYEFVANNTLEHHLHGTYISIFFFFSVADFGLAKLTTDNNTHVSTRVMGTFGYLAPEYASSGKLTDKSDVFSFGVMLLELITGRRPVDPTNYMEDSLVDWARPLLARALSEDGSFDELVDQRLDSKLDRVELERMAACAAAAIVRALEGDASLDDLSEGVKPGQSMMFSSGSEYDSGNYASNISKFRKTAFESSIEDSSEYGHSQSQSSADSGEPPRRQQQR
ncbi:hypothetical protein ABZP36_020113 [Zizania latifolia]